MQKDLLHNKIDDASQELINNVEKNVKENILAKNCGILLDLCDQNELLRRLTGQTEVTHHKTRK